MENTTKDLLINDLKNCFQEVVVWVNNQPGDNFNKEIIANKWTIAGHVYHLIKTTKAVSIGLSMPKETLASMFGKNKREENSFQEMDEKFKTTVAKEKIKAPSNFEPKPGRIFEKESLLKRFEGELNDLEKSINKWQENEMSIYLLMHPILGKCTLREFIYFTILHTNHHLNILKEKYKA